MDVKVDDSLFLCAFHDALAQWRAADFREQRDDVDLHRGRNIERPIRLRKLRRDRHPTSNAELKSALPERRYRIYSTISRIARWPWRAAELASNARIAWMVWPPR